MMEGKLAVVKHDLREAELAAVAARTLVRQNLNEWEDDIVVGCDTETALIELKRLHALRGKITDLRAQKAKLEEALGK
ncbi:MAG TPA: hypothetical protein PLL10_01545 [Elusimicrobiales bacterium]|nr:hypothetical protein [Elusimicrobiales bacterium]